MILSDSSRLSCARPVASVYRTSAARARGGVRHCPGASSGSRVSMGAHIIQVDLAQPLPTLPTAADRRHAGALWILVKLGPQPVGWVRCEDPIARFGKQMGPDQLLKLVNDALSRPIQAAARERAHEPIVLARTPA